MLNVTRSYDHLNKECISKLKLFFTLMRPATGMRSPMTAILVECASQGVQQWKIKGLCLSWLAREDLKWKKENRTLVRLSEIFGFQRSMNQSRKQTRQSFDYDLTAFQEKSRAHHSPSLLKVKINKSQNPPLESPKNLRNKSSALLLLS